MLNYIRIFFLLLANVIILVHSFIPHYHVGENVHCCTAGHHHYENHPQDFHFHPGGVLLPQKTEKHHGGISFEDCLLDRIYIRFDNSNHTLQSANTEIVFLITSLFLNSLDSVLFETDTGNFPFRQKPYLQTSYTEVISRSSGLRAPPFC